MTTKNQKLQSLLSLYRERTGKSEVEMYEFAEWAIKNGVEAPKSKTPVELLAEAAAAAAREEHRVDPETGWEYRANHAYRAKSSDGKQMTLWVELER